MVDVAASIPTMKVDRPPPDLEAPIAADCAGEDNSKLDSIFLSMARHATNASYFFNIPASGRQRAKRLIIGYFQAMNDEPASYDGDGLMRQMVTLGDLVGRIERLEVRCTRARATAGGNGRSCSRRRCRTGPAAAGDAPGRGLPQGQRAKLAPAHMAQDGAHLGQELTDAERIGDVVARISVQGRDLTALIIAAGEHENGSV